MKRLAVVVVVLWGVVAQAQTAQKTDEQWHEDPTKLGVPKLEQKPMYGPDYKAYVDVDLYTEDDLRLMMRAAMLMVCREATPAPYTCWSADAGTKHIEALIGVFRTVRTLGRNDPGPYRFPYPNQWLLPRMPGDTSWWSDDYKNGFKKKEKP